MKLNQGEAARRRLYAATEQLKIAADEFVSAHAGWSGGHRPILWATYLDCDDAVIVCEKSWAGRIHEVLGEGEPMVVIPFNLEPLGES